MEFRILGPVEVVADGRSISLGPLKQRALLAILLVRANEVVSRDRLIEDLWGEEPPETAATALHGYVSQLRKSLAASDGAKLITRPPGYQLEVDPRHVDVKRFELLAERGKRELVAGDPAAAAATLTEALSLWRGRPLAEFDSAPFALPESLRLEELRLSTLEDRIEADLALGRHHDLVGELETLVAEHPFRELLCGQLMLALYRCGRQADALAVYTRTRRRLIAELGIEPGPALRDLQQAILRQDDELAAPARRDLEAPPRVAEPPREAGVEAGAAPRRRSGRVTPLSPQLLAVGSLAALALAVVLGFALRARDEPSPRLAPNSVGFIDAQAHRVIKSFAVGREPRALVIAFDSIWVANYRDQTLSRLDRATGRGHTIPVGGHPTSLAASAHTVWVWTLEGWLVPIDPRFDSARARIRLPRQAPSGRVMGEVAAGSGLLWVSAPPTTVVRMSPVEPRRRVATVPDAGVQGPLVYADGDVWVAGSNDVFAIDPVTGTAGPGIAAGPARDLAFADGDLWAVTGGPGHVAGIGQALRRIDLQSRLIEDTIRVGSNPVAVAAAEGSIWVASGSDRTVSRVDPSQDEVVDSVSVTASPTALAADRDGVWIAVR